MTFLLLNANNFQKNRINPRHILLALRTDQELDKLSAGVTVHQGGAMPNIQAFSTILKIEYAKFPYFKEALFPGNHPRKAQPKDQQQDQHKPTKHPSNKHAGSKKMGKMTVLCG